MTDDLVKRLHWHRDFIGTNPWPDGYPFLQEVRDRLGDAADRIETLTAERDRLALAICGGEDAHGYAHAQTVEALEYALKQNRQSHWATINSLLAAEAERDRLREALHQIEITCDEEVCVRTAGMSEAALGKSRILPLLQIPRNIARAALKGESHE